MLSLCYPTDPPVPRGPSHLPRVGFEVEGVKGMFPPTREPGPRGCPEEQLLPTRWTDRILLLQRP